MEFIQGTVGHICYVVVVFTAGALIGQPLWAWVKKMMPWGK